MHRILFVTPVSFCAAIALADYANAGPYSFQTVGQLPGGYTANTGIDLSADGSVIVGGAVGFGSDPLEQAFRWTEATGIVGMGFRPGMPGPVQQSYAMGVSSDGSVAVGWSNGQAFRWTAETGIVGLGTLPGSSTSLGRDVSADGSVVVGYDKSSREEAFRWTAASGMIGLGDFPGGSFRSRAEGVSPDGGTVLGWGSSASGTEAFRWTAATGMVGLGDLPGGSFSSEAFAASNGGAVIVGSAWSASGPEAFRWTAAGGMVGLGDFPGGDHYSFATDVTSDGTMVVGASFTAAGPEAFYWTQATGLVNLKAFLLSHGVSEVAPWQLSECYAVSPDGRTFTGGAFDPVAGGGQAFIATIPEPSSAVLAACAAMTILLTAGFRRRCGYRRNRKGTITL